MSRPSISFANTLRALLAVLYVVAGIFHLAWPAPFLTITPAWVPLPTYVIAATGLCEIAGAFALYIPSLRNAAGIALALYAVAVFPANIKHAAMDFHAASPGLGLWYHIPRLALQPLIVWAALYVRKPR
jgi:uncharacterized membrane protein